MEILKSILRLLDTSTDLLLPIVVLIAGFLPWWVRCIGSWVRWIRPYPRVAMDTTILLPLDIFINVLDVAHHQCLVISWVLVCIHRLLCALLQHVSLIRMELILLRCWYPLVHAHVYPILCCHDEARVLHHLHTLWLSGGIQIQIHI